MKSQVCLQGIPRKIGSRNTQEYAWIHFDTYFTDARLPLNVEPRTGENVSRTQKDKHKTRTQETTLGTIKTASAAASATQMIGTLNITVSYYIVHA